MERIYYKLLWRQKSFWTAIQKFLSKVRLKIVCIRGNQQVSHQSLLKERVITCTWCSSNRFDKHKCKHSCVITQSCTKRIDWHNVLDISRGDVMKMSYLLAELAWFGTVSSHKCGLISAVILYASKRLASLSLIDTIYGENNKLKSRTAINRKYKQDAAWDSSE